MPNLCDEFVCHADVLALQADANGGFILYEAITYEAQVNFISNKLENRVRLTTWASNFLYLVAKI